MDIRRLLLKPFQSLSGRVIIIIGACLLIILGASTYYTSEKSKKQLLDLYREELNLISHVVLKSVSDAMLQAKGEELQETLAKVATLEDIDELWVLNRDGTIVVDAKEKKKGQIAYQDDLLRSHASLFTAEANDHMNMATLVPIQNEKACWGCHDSQTKVLGYLSVQLPLSRLENALAVHRRTQLGAAVAIFFLISLVTALVFSRMVTAPLRELTTKMLQVQEGDLQAQVPVQRNDQIGRLARAFNSMVKRLLDAKKEIELHHHQQLERADRLANMGQLAAGAAHEINNPTGIILTRTGYLLRRAEEEHLSVPVVEDLRAIESQTHRISRIIKDLLNFSKLTTYYPQNVSLNELVDKILLILEPRLKYSNVRLFKNLAAPFSQIQADPSQIEHLITNLVNNAIDAMPAGGNLIIRTEQADRKGNNEYILLSILDSGVGIPKGNLEKIFEPFFTTKESGKGTGLGLSISLGIVNTHNGWMEVKSEVGRGTEFRVFLPLIRSAQA